MHSERVRTGISSLPRFPICRGQWEGGTTSYIPTKIHANYQITNLATRLSSAFYIAPEPTQSIKKPGGKS